MKDIKLMMNFIKQTASILYGKDVFFYDDNEDKWYSREHSGCVEFETIIQWLEDRVFPLISEPDEIIDCEYCEKVNDEDVLQGTDGVIKKNDEYMIYIEHFRGEGDYITDIKYCPMCGRKLVDNED